MIDTTWHAPASLIEQYAADPSSVDDARASSLEAHLVGCAACRDALDTMVGPFVAVESWSALVDVIDRPHERLLEWGLRRMRVPEGWSRLLGATPAFTLAWLAAVAAITALIVALAGANDATGGFLVVAPLVPLVLVTGVFAPVSDPAGEAGVATAMHGFGLVVRRAVIVGVTAFVALGVADLALGDLGAPVAAWVLPSLVLSVSVIALATWIPAEVAAVVLVGAWLIGVAIVWWIRDGHVEIAATPIFGVQGQMLWIALLALAAVAVVMRRERFSTMEVFG